MAATAFKWFLVPAILLLAGFTGKRFVSSTRATRHPFFISVTEINQNTKEKTLEISCKIFADDFENILKKNYKTIVDLAAAKDKSSLNRLIPDYIGKHLALVVDGKAVTLSYVGFEKDKESAYAYFEVENISSLKKIDINNSILHDFTADQVNIIHVTVNDKRQSTKLDYPSRQASFSF